MGDGMGSLPRALQKYHQEICNDPSIQLLHTNTSSTTRHTIPPIACTINSHTHPHTTDHIHFTNTTTSITTLTPIVFAKQPRLKKTKSARTISTASPITTSAPTIFPTKSCSKKTKQSTQITIPKRHAPTLSPFISTNIRLKCHKKSPSHLNTTGQASQHTPPPVPLLLPPPQKTHPTRKFQPLRNSPPPPLLYTTLPPLSSIPLLPPLTSTPPLLPLPSTPPLPPLPSKPPLQLLPSTQAPPHKQKSLPLWN